MFCSVCNKEGVGGVLSIGCGIIPSIYQMAHGTGWFHCLEWPISLSPSRNMQKHLEMENSLQNSWKQFHKIQQDSAQHLHPQFFPSYRGRNWISIGIPHCCLTRQHKLKGRNHLPRKKWTLVWFTVHTREWNHLKMFKYTKLKLNTRKNKFHCGHLKAKSFFTWIWWLLDTISPWIILGLNQWIFHFSACGYFQLDFSYTKHPFLNYFKINWIFF